LKKLLAQKKLTSTTIAWTFSVFHWKRSKSPRSIILVDTHYAMATFASYAQEAKDALKEKELKRFGELK